MLSSMRYGKKRKSSSMPVQMSCETAHNMPQLIEKMIGFRDYGNTVITKQVSNFKQPWILSSALHFRID